MLGPKDVDIYHVKTGTSQIVTYIKYLSRILIKSNATDKSYFMIFLQTADVVLVFSK